MGLVRDGIELFPRYPDEAHRALAAVGQRLGGAEQLIHRLAVTIHGGGAGRGPLATYEGVLRALSPDARVRRLQTLPDLCLQATSAWIRSLGARKA